MSGTTQQVAAPASGVAIGPGRLKPMRADNWIQRGAWY